MTGELSPVEHSAPVPAQSAPSQAVSSPAASAPSQSELRASHADRDRVVELLRVAAGDGRLTADELDERLEVALTARTYAELAVLTTDLPAAPSAAIPPTPLPARDLVRIDCGSGSTRRDGRWIVPRRMEVDVSSGAVRLDFTAAVFTSPVLELAARVRSGSLRLVTAPGMVVDADDVVVRSGTVKVRAPHGPDTAVTLRVTITGQVDSGSLRAQPKRRSFWQWLLRRPVSPA